MYETARTHSPKGPHDPYTATPIRLAPRGVQPRRARDVQRGRLSQIEERGVIESSVHVPVLVDEILSFLALAPGAVVVDATVGAGGHALQLLPRILPGGRLVGIDRDPEILEIAGARLRPFGDAARLVHARADEIDAVLEREGLTAVDAVLLDLGVSSLQLDRAARGFSFDQDGPLDMRMDPRTERTAADFVNHESEATIAKCLRELADERFANRIARAIVTARARRPFRRTLELADLVARSVPSPRPGRGHARLHPATRTFQALRIAVNDELGNLERALPKAVAALRPGGRVAVVSFHSLEDGIVKRFFRDEARAGRLQIETKKPVGPGDAEVERNPRSRSARLRVARRADASRAGEGGA
jgi:16S rRNA (cytosine1402-N4)-methyltransferase